MTDRIPTPHRRDFVKTVGASGIGLCLATGQAPVVGAVGANDKIRMGIIGTGERGTHHIRQFANRKDVEIVAVCDVDTSRREQGAQIAEEIQGKKPDDFNDFRKILDRKDIDAVVVAPPDHWHALIAVKACEAGKDVYVEKPIGHNIREGRLVVEAARKHNRVVTIGTQQRSGPHFIQAVDWVKSGTIGQVTLVRVWNAWWTNEMGGGRLKRVPDSDPPEGVDYDTWLGPAPKRPFNPNRFHFCFYFYWDYSGGMMSAWAIHHFDVVMWAMGYNINSVQANGGIYYFDDGREAPDTAQATFECPGYLLIYEMRHGNGYRLQGNQDNGIEFHGDKGTVILNRDRSILIPHDGEQVEVENQGMDEFHIANFLDCMRSRQQPNGNAQTGHEASICGHLANIAYRVGRRIAWDAEKETIPDDAEACTLLTREYRKPWVF